MEELGQFDDEFQKKQKKLMIKQQKFEEEQREYEKHAAEIEAKEKKKRKIISWLVILGMLVFVVILAYLLL